MARFYDITGTKLKAFFLWILLLAPETPLAQTPPAIVQPNDFQTALMAAVPGTVLELAGDNYGAISIESFVAHQSSQLSFAQPILPIPQYFHLSVCRMWRIWCLKGWCLTTGLRLGNRTMRARFG